MRNRLPIKSVGATGQLDETGPDDRVGPVGPLSATVKAPVLGHVLLVGDFDVALRSVAWTEIGCRRRSNAWAVTCARVG